MTINELPDFWRSRYEEILGISPPDHSSGVLQDVHWFCGTIGGYFQGYSLGDLAHGQFFEAVLQDHPHLMKEVEKGSYETLRSWLREKIHRHGNQFTPREILQRSTGRELSVGPFLNYITEKYEKIYRL